MYRETIDSRQLHRGYWRKNRTDVTRLEENPKFILAPTQAVMGLSQIVQSICAACPA
jgi:hypothetical protein